MYCIHKRVCTQKISGMVFHTHRVSWHNIPTISCRKVAIHLDFRLLKSALLESQAPVALKLKLNVRWSLLGRAVFNTWRVGCTKLLVMAIYNALLEMQPDIFSWHLPICLFTLFTAGLTNEKEMWDIQKSLGLYRAQTDCMWSNPS